MKHKAVRYSQLQQPPARRVRVVNYLDGFWINLFKDYVILLLSSYKRFYLARSRKLSTKGWLFALIGVLFLALIPAPKAHAAYLDPIMPITPQIGLKQPLELPKIAEQALLPVPAPVASVAVYSVAGNLYQPGQCTWHVKNLKPGLPNNLGDANLWYLRAQAQGLPIGLEPRAGAAGQVKGAMHVVYILSVNNSNGTVLISEMNYDWVPYHQRQRIANANEFYYIY